MARIENKYQKAVRKFREFVIGRMKSLGLSQSEVAEDMYLKQTTFSYKLRNNNFNFEELVRLFEILNVEPDELVGLMLKGG